MMLLCFHKSRVAWQWLPACRPTVRVQVTGMKKSKGSLRTLPVMLRLSRSPAGTAAVMGVRILCIVLLYGIMELSHFFAYAWYLHLICFVIKPVALVPTESCVAAAET